jgi:hypothetical protein
MTKLKVNPEFFRRHLFVTVLMAGLGAWFAYDGYVKYPSQSEEYFAELHLEKETATKRQRQFMVLAFIASLAVGVHLAKVCRFDFAYDDEGFVYKGERFAYGEVKSVDRSKWEKKGIIKVDGIVLDAWHHLGVKEVAAKL